MLHRFLDREEYIEQAYFFRVYRERLEDNLPSQEALESIREEVLATTKLPIALDFLRGEILLTGRISDGMKRLAHYFRPFQSYVMERAEEERSRFDQKTALHVLQREAEYLSGGRTSEIGGRKECQIAPTSDLQSPTADSAEGPCLAGLFLYQFECVARNRLGYDGGMKAIAADPHFPAEWSDWVMKSRLRLGTIDFADMIYYRSEHFVIQQRQRLQRPDYQPAFPLLFGVQEGRIAKANTGKDPLFMFAALQRQLGHPAVPRARAAAKAPALHPAVEQRIQRLEQRVQLLESEQKGGLDLSEFYARPADFSKFDSDKPDDTR